MRRIKKKSHKLCLNLQLLSFVDFTFRFQRFNIAFGVFIILFFSLFFILLVHRFMSENTFSCSHLSMKCEMITTKNISKLIAQLFGLVNEIKHIICSPDYWQSHPFIQPVFFYLSTSSYTFGWMAVMPINVRIVQSSSYKLYIDENFVHKTPGLSKWISSRQTREKNLNINTLLKLIWSMNDRTLGFCLFVRVEFGERRKERIQNDNRTEENIWKRKQKEFYTKNMYRTI